MPWETEKDSSRRTVSYVVDGFTKGYYYEDVSAPGVFPVYAFSINEQDYVKVQAYGSEKLARQLLQMIIPAARREALEKSKR